MTAYWSVLLTYTKRALNVNFPIRRCTMTNTWWCDSDVAIYYFYSVVLSTLE